MPLTLEDIASLINSNKEEILNKVDGVVEDVKANSQEEKNVQMNERSKLLEKEIIELKKPRPQPSFAQVASTNQFVPYQDQTRPATYNESEDGGGPKDHAIRKLISDGKRVIGLSPLDQNVIDIQLEEGAQDEEQAKNAAAQYFLTGDMNIPKSTVERMKIVRVFKAFNALESDRLYVEFESESSVNILSRYKRNLAPDRKVSLWFPHDAL